jgi:hypothetical protein
LTSIDHGAALARGLAAYAVALGAMFKVPARKAQL